MYRSQTYRYCRHWTRNVGAPFTVDGHRMVCATGGCMSSIIPNCPLRAPIICMVFFSPSLSVMYHFSGLDLS